MEEVIIMKKYVLRIVRRYRRCFVKLAIKCPDCAIKYWYDFTCRTDGVLDLLATDSSLSISEHMLICNYLAIQWKRLFNIYCK